MTKPLLKPPATDEASTAAAYVEVETPRVEQVSSDFTCAAKSKDDSCGIAETEGKPPATPPVPLSQFYRYATAIDKFCLAFGMLCAGINGALFPLMALLYGNATSAFKADGSVDFDVVNKAALEFFIVAIALFVTDYVAYVMFVNTAEMQMKALREEALKHMLYMDVTWFDSNDALQLSSRLTGDTVKIKDGMGPKLGDSFKYTVQFCTGYVIGFSRGWDMTLVMLCVTPMMVLSLGWLLKMLRTRSEKAQNMYAEAGAVAEETLGSIRTVASLNGEKRAIAKYNSKIEGGMAEKIQVGKYSSVVFGLFFGSIWIMYAAGLWYGGSRVAAADMTPAKVFQVFFGVMMGTISLAQVGPSISAVAEARGVAVAIYKILDTPSAVDASKDDGFVPESCSGHIQAIDLHFAYPTRPEAPILRGYSVNIEAGQTVAFVGASGGGKSTLIALLERFYNPQSGQILLDGRDISTLNISWLRSQIGMVSQEPVLFARTIYENIAAGGDSITREQAIEAAKMANAHNFIMTLPQQYDTLVGEKGVSLSGGQKQRVAIARAVVRNPKILVLDEATSALDAESERIVQDALNDLLDKTKMTTLVIAHRLSTIRRADKIVVLAGGRVVEEGTHDELLAIENGVYNNLYTIQDVVGTEKAMMRTEQIIVKVDGGSRAALGRASSGLSTGNTQQTHAPSTIEDGKEKKFTLFDVLSFSRQNSSCSSLEALLQESPALASPFRLS